MPYKISGTSSDNSRIYVLQNDSLVGYKDNNYGNYNVVFDSSTPSGLTVVSENPNGEALAFGGITAISTEDSSNITPTAGMVFKSIQAGTINWTDPGGAAVGYGSKTITAVDPTKSFVLWNGYRSISGAAYSGLLYLNSSTQLQTYFEASSNGTVAYTVIEFESGIKSIQRGILSEVDEVGDTYDVTISAVDTSKSFVSSSSGVAANFTDPANYVTVALINSTTVRFSNLGSVGRIGGKRMAYEIVEFE